MKCPVCESYMDKDGSTWYCTGCSYKFNEHSYGFLMLIIIAVIIIVMS